MNKYDGKELFSEIAGHFEKRVPYEIKQLKFLQENLLEEKNYKENVENYIALKYVSKTYDSTKYPHYSPTFMLCSSISVISIGLLTNELFYKRYFEVNHPLNAHFTNIFYNLATEINLLIEQKLEYTVCTQIKKLIEMYVYYKEFQNNISNFHKFFENPFNKIQRINNMLKRQNDPSAKHDAKQTFTEYTTDDFKTILSDTGKYNLLIHFLYEYVVEFSSGMSFFASGYLFFTSVEDFALADVGMLYMVTLSFIFDDLLKNFKAELLEHKNSDGLKESLILFDAPLKMTSEVLDQKQINKFIKRFDLK